MPSDVTLLGSLWLSAHQESLARYASSPRDVGAFCEAAYQLKSFLERCPEEASRARQLALFQMNIGQSTAPRAVMVLLGETALRASLIMPLEKDTEAAAIRELLVASSELKEWRLFEALDHMNCCRSSLAPIAGTPLGRWAAAKEAQLRGDLCVEAFELEAAAGHYSNAHSHAFSLLSDISALDEFCRTWSDLIAPPAADRERRLTSLESAARWEVKYIVLSALQSAAAINRNTSNPNALMAVRDAFSRIGRVQLVRSLYLVHALARVSGDERVAFCSLLKDMANNRVVDFLTARQGEQPSGSPSSSLESSAQEVNEIVMTEHLAEVESYLIAGDHVHAAAVWNEHLRETIATRMAFPQLFAFGQQLRLFAGRNDDDERRAFQQFLQLLGPVISEVPTLLLDPRYRSLIDPSIEVATAYAVDGISRDVSDTTAASALLALQCSPMVSSFPRLLGFPTGNRNTCEQGVEFIADALKRIRLGLKRWDDAVVVITQQRPLGVVFICCESPDDPPQVVRSSQEFVDAMNNLNQAALDSQGSKEPAVHSAVERQGKEAFAALPKNVRAAIRRHQIVLLVPDYSARHDAWPFELMHDGRGYLLSRRVLARFTSVQHLASTLDTSRKISGHRRALVIGIDHAKGCKPLPLAETERREICHALTAAGFDAPQVPSERITTGRFITDRLSFVDIFHAAGHGETALGTERLILPDGNWLDSMALERQPQSSLPFVYLSTCELGETRFLGGGRGRGLAFSFAARGAPAVLAYTTPVFSDASAALATAFYRAALTRPVGEALRCARQELLVTYPASEIGRLVLLGNPRHGLPGVEQLSPDDPTNDLLDWYFDLNATRKARSEVLTYFLNCGQPTPRLAAAARLIYAREEAMQTGAGNDPIELKEAISLAEAINHRSSAALLKSKLARLAAERRAEDAREYARAALLDVNVLARVDRRWEDHRKQLVELILRLELEERGIDLNRLRRTTEESPDMLQGLVGALAGTESLWQIESPEMRETESGLGDIAWNAVLAGYGQRLEYVPERLTVVAAVVDKLVSGQHLTVRARDYAIPVLATVLSCVWSAHTHGASSKECTAGEARLVERLVLDLNSSWSPPSNKLLAIVSAVPDAIDAALKKLAAAGYAGVYQMLDREMDALRALALKTVATAHAKHPDMKNCSSCFVAGSFLVKNTFDAAFQDSFTPSGLSEIFDALSVDIRNLAADACLGSDKDNSRDELARWRAIEESHDSRSVRPPVLAADAMVETMRDASDLFAGE